MIHVYYGEGQGKTTAAMGLALRAVAAGWKVCVVQFLKDGSSGEMRVLRGLAGVTVFDDGDQAKFTIAMDETERAAARRVHDANLRAALDLTDAACGEGTPVLLVLDEVLDAHGADLLDDALLREALARGRESVELVITGHTLPVYVLDVANYATKMECVRHPYACGTPAREGVEF